MDVHIDGAVVSEEKLSRKVRREQIARQALRLIAAGGLRQLSVARLAHHVGLVPSAIYRHFRGKDEILDAALDGVRDRLLRNVQEVCAQTPRALPRLHGLLVRNVRMIRENLAMPRIVFSDELYSGNPGRKAEVRRILTAYLEAVGRIVRQGQRGGEIRRDLDAGTVALLFFGTFQPAGIVWHVTEGDFDVTRHAEGAWRMFTDAVRAPAGRSRRL